jgi:hypothetical protein
MNGRRARYTDRDEPGPAVERGASEERGAPHE